MRPGEGFQQEAAEAFEQTNMKKAKKQVCQLLFPFSNTGNLNCGLDGPN